MNRGILALPSFPRTATLDTLLGFTLHGPIFNCDPHPGNILVDKETGPPWPPIFWCDTSWRGRYAQHVDAHEKKILLSGPFRYKNHICLAANFKAQSDEPTPCALWTGRLCVLDWGQVRQLSQPERFLPGCINFFSPAAGHPTCIPRVWRSSPFFHLFLHHDQVIAKGRNIFCLLIIWYFVILVGFVHEDLHMPRSLWPHWWRMFTFSWKAGTRNWLHHCTTMLDSGWETCETYKVVPFTNVNRWEVRFCWDTADSTFPSWLNFICLSDSFGNMTGQAFPYLRH